MSELVDEPPRRSAGRKVTKAGAGRTKAASKVDLGSFDEGVDAPADREPPTRERARLGTGVDMRREVEREHLVLGVREIGEAIAKVLANADGELCFALYGPWGRGKTTLARLVCEQLRSRTTAPRYRNVWFNAWKYRSPPEVWAHLYERLAQAATSGGALAKPTQAIRANLSRLGLWPLTAALFSLAIALLPMSAELEGDVPLFVQIAGVLGALGATWITFAFRKTAEVTGRVWKLYGALPSHHDRLGLQATIGEDLRHLLCGWISVPYLRRRASTDAADEPTSKQGGWVQAIFCGLGVGALASAIVFAISPKGGPTPIAYVGVPLAVIGLTVAASWVVMQYGRKLDRVLLVVDDLDRCPPGLMLEILESIKLLVEEPGVRERLQVMVLVDEEMLFRAVADRFEAYVQRTPEGRRDELRRRLVHEHLDKIFLGDFRLGTLSGPDVEALVERFASVEGRSGAGAVRDADAPPAGLRGGRAPLETLGAARDADPEGSISFSSDEQKVLVAQCKALLDGRAAHRLGPRSIKSVILRYQLARLLLSMARLEVDPALIVRRIVSASLPARELDLDHARRSTAEAEAIIEQVAGIDYFRIDLSSDDDPRHRAEVDAPSPAE